MFNFPLRHFRECQAPRDAVSELDRARRAAISRGDYQRAADYRQELVIFLALREATAREIRSGEFFED